MHHARFTGIDPRHSPRGNQSIASLHFQRTATGSALTTPAPDGTFRQKLPFDRCRMRLGRIYILAFFRNPNQFPRTPPSAFSHPSVSVNLLLICSPISPRIARAAEMDYRYCNCSCRRKSARNGGHNGGGASVLRAELSKSKRNYSGREIPKNRGGDRARLRRV